MGDAIAPVRPGYFQQYLARMAPTPLPPPPLPFAPSSTKPVLPLPAPSARRAATNDAKGKPKARKTLVDAFKQHGMKLCDGSKLNVVAKGVTHLGMVPPTLGVHITALYLSQNGLTRLDGIEQFKNVRLLSVAANRLVRFADIERLKELPQLRHLNLAGNPLCDHPNYRVRVVDALRQLVVLDTIEISKQERELAPFAASQDHTLRDMVMKNHLEIQKLQRITVWIRVLGEFQCGVLRDAVTGRYDQLPSPHGESVFNTERFVRLWHYEDSLGQHERDLLEAQMMAIIARTRLKLTEETPQSKAKEMLLKLAKASAARRGDLNELPPAMRREQCVWEDAYAHILQLQQQTIANLRCECDRNRQAVLQSMRDLIVVNPSQRHALALRGESSWNRERALRPMNRDAGTETNGVRDIPRQSMVTPMPQDPDTEPQDQSSQNQVLSRPTDNQQRSPTESKPVPRQNPLTLRRVLRSGQFGNKTLNEAVHSFSLRQPEVPKAPARRLRVQKAVLHQASASRSREYNNDSTERVMTPQEAILTKSTTPSLMKSSLNSPWTRRDGFSNEVDLADVVGSETEYSGGTLYASSIGGVSLRDDDFADSGPAAFRVSSSRAQHSRPPDRIIHHRAMQPHELNTVHEDESVANDMKCSNQEEAEETEELKHFGVPRPRFLSERQHELEAREEKYIIALTESEQRELDLRQQISSMNAQLTRFQQLLSERADERLRIKLEINERTAAVARPRLLRRFFVRWVHYHHWSLQVHHFHRKRAFVVQHDAFWCWRRQLWAQQQLRRIRKRHQLRLLRSHLTEWANITRISVIALHTQALRQSQLVKRVVDEWRQQVYVDKLMKSMLICRGQASSQQQLVTSFCGWKRVTTQIRRARKLHHFYTRGVANAAKISAFRTWRMYVLAIARPQRIQVAAFAASRLQTIKKTHFISWKRVAKAERLCALHLCRSMWQAWRLAVQIDVAEREHTVTLHSRLLKANFVEWRQVAVERAACRRSLNLATRHVNHRRLRKLWMYWKIYSIARKRYIQGASKALKHYYMKLLRRTWGQWKRETKDNLVSIKSKKRGELLYHFNALRAGVDIQLQEKKRQVFVSHATKRRLLHLVQQTFEGWVKCSKRRRRCKTLHNALSRNRSRTLLGYVWSRWKQERFLRVKGRLLQVHQHNQIKAEAQRKAEQELVVLNDRSVSLADQVRRLTAQVREQAKEMRTYQDELQQRELEMDDLEKQLDDATQRLLQAEDDRNDTSKVLEEREKELLRQLGALKKDNATLNSANGELEQRISSLSRSLVEAQSENTSLKGQFIESQSEVEKVRHASEEREQLLRDTIESLEKRIEEEHAEREETVRRLQEYEARIASTCAEISDHEHAHEQECIKLRAENTRLDILQKEAAVRSTELERLLSEKNEQIIALSIRLKDARSNDERRSQLRHQYKAPEELAPKDLTSSSIVSITREKTTQIEDTTQHEMRDDAPVEKSSKLVMPDSVICVPVKNVHHCVLVATEESNSESRPGSTTIPEPSNPVPPVPSEEERRIDERTSQIHADIQLLQERITKRLQQVPCVPSMHQLALTQRAKRTSDSDECSVSTISESETERDRKTRRRPTLTAPDPTSRSNGVPTSLTRQRIGARNVVNRENTSRLANHSASRVVSTVNTQKARAEPYPPQRPLASKSTSKTKKGPSGRTITKAKSKLISSS